MASCKFEGGKYKGASEVKAHFRHDDISPERRAIAQKKNKDIDLAKCKYNFNILGLSYEERCKKYDDRITYLDSHGNTNKRKDRVTVQCIEIPAPAGLPRDKYHDWFFRVADILRNKYGEENFIDADIHYDEEHTYRDPETRELVVSRVHGHYMIVPEVNGKLNAKEISLRRNMKALNNEVEAMTKAEFGCSFMTGTKKKSTKKVEELKQESENAELLYQIEQGMKTLDARQTALEAREAILNDRDKELQAREKELLKTQNALSEWQDNLEKRELAVKDLEDQARVIKQERSTIREKESHIDEVIKAISEIPSMDSVVKAVLKRSVVDVPISSTSKRTVQMPAMEYLERLQASRKQRADLICKKAGYTTNDYPSESQHPQDSMEF